MNNQTLGKDNMMYKDEFSIFCSIRRNFRSSQEAIENILSFCFVSDNYRKLISIVCYIKKDDDEK